jgi:tRNA G10  N-methylase Trm11
MIYKSMLILGRQPAIGLAELESVLGSEHVMPLRGQAAVSDINADDVPFERLGGSIRVANIIGEMDATQWPSVSRVLYKALPALLQNLPAEGKLKLGLSVFGVQATSQHLFRTGLEMKKICKQAGRSVRLVPNTELELNSASVLHNQLTGDLGIELLLVRSGNKTWLAKTTAVQDIDAYAARDQGRPKRDARVGMLPPKLAQIIVNLGVGQLDTTNTVLDPFCGTGVVLQEAAIMGYGVYGTDLESRMIEYTQKNLEWLITEGPYGIMTTPKLEAGDATTHTWQPAPQAIACETYLGRPLSGWPNPDKMQEIIGTCNVIIEKFMRNIASQIPTGTRCCLAIPAWKSPQGRVYHLSLLDRLDDLGYNRVSFEHAEASELVYSRPDQIVARELLVITRK